MKQGEKEKEYKILLEKAQWTNQKELENQNEK